MNDPYAYYNAHMHSAFIARNARLELTDIEDRLLESAVRKAQREETMAAIKQAVASVLKRITFTRTARHTQAQIGA